MKRKIGGRENPCRHFHFAISELTVSVSKNGVTPFTELHRPLHKSFLIRRWQMRFPFGEYAVISDVGNTDDIPMG